MKGGRIRPFHLYFGELLDKHCNKCSQKCSLLVPLIIFFMVFAKSGSTSWISFPSLYLSEIEAKTTITLRYPYERQKVE